MMETQQSWSNSTARVKSDQEQAVRKVVHFAVFCFLNKQFSLLIIETFKETKKHT